MTLQGILSEEAWTALGDTLKAEYVKGEDERYYVDVAAVDGWAFENVTALQTTMRSERDSRKEWERKHSDLTRTLNGASAEDIAGLGAMKKELERLRKLPDEEKTAERLRELETEYNGKLTDAEATRIRDVETRDRRIKSLVLEGTAGKALRDLKCIDPSLHMTAVEAAVQIAADGSLSIVDSAGDPRQTAKKGAVGPMALEEYLEELKTQYPQNFKGTGAAGGGADPSGAGGPGGQKRGDDFAKLPPGERLLRLRREQAAR